MRSLLVFLLLQLELQQTNSGVGTDPDGGRLAIGNLGEDSGGFVKSVLLGLNIGLVDPGDTLLRYRFRGRSKLSESIQSFWKVALVLQRQGDGVFYEQVLAVVGCFFAYELLEGGDRLIEQSGFQSRVTS